ncbi:glycoside hydrolase family 16 protein [Kocuria sp. LUK]|uniref:glycoside hydrolase family 16 protein n=1 Tax=Kocuria sp. LUK TaxID=2897828 RepID=UPI001E3F1F5A|nr:glycoside hydrolase family 16 protein [Kocuria sp. LUK]MCD1144979.1 glycoside hydrolase family 16 protein [Kocuria sp. LUK]
MRTKREFRWVTVAGLIIVGSLLAGCSSSDIGTTTGDVRVWPADDPGVGSHPGPNPKQGILLDDGFDGNTLGASTWNTCHWWQDRGCTIVTNNELEWYLPEQVQVSDGALHMTAERSEISASNGRDYDFASGMVTTGPPAHDMPSKLQFTYGKVEVRFQVPSGRGLWPAIWLLPASEDSRPEIDMLEVTGEDTGRLIMHLHPKDRSAPPIRKDYFLPEGRSLADGWHTISLDWSPNKLTYLLDGKQVWQVLGKQVPDEPMYLVMNLAVGGSYPGNPDKNTTFPAVFKIDRVRILGNS